VRTSTEESKGFRHRNFSTSKSILARICSVSALRARPSSSTLFFISSTLWQLARSREQFRNAIFTSKKSGTNKGEPTTVCWSTKNMGHNRRGNDASLLFLGVKLIHTGYQIPVSRYQLNAYVPRTRTAGTVNSKDTKALYPQGPQCLVVRTCYREAKSLTVYRIPPWLPLVAAGSFVPALQVQLPTQCRNAKQARGQGAKHTAWGALLHGISFVDQNTKYTVRQQLLGEARVQKQKRIFVWLFNGLELKNGPPFRQTEKNIMWYSLTYRLSVSFDQLASARLCLVTKVFQGARSLTYMLKVTGKE